MKFICMASACSMRREASTRVWASSRSRVCRDMPVTIWRLTAPVTMKSPATNKNAPRSFVWTEMWRRATERTSAPSGQRLSRKRQSISPRTQYSNRDRNGLPTGEGDLP